MGLGWVRGSYTWCIDVDLAGSVRLHDDQQVRIAATLKVQIEIRVSGPRNGRRVRVEGNLTDSLQHCQEPN